MIAGAPFVKTSKSTVVDSAGTRLGCYPAALASVALTKSCSAFRERGTRIAIASRTHRGNWARELLNAFEVHGDDDDVLALASCVDFVDIASGSKTKHFARLREKSGVSYADMLFFDNERENIDEVARLGVACVHCPGGLSADAWRRGLTFFVDDVIDPE
jgi:magnesium-dependent phosphatase 1